MDPRCPLPLRDGDLEPSPSRKNDDVTPHRFLGSVVCRRSTDVDRGAENEEDGSMSCS